MLEGTCHCGGVRWILKTMPESVTACNCTSCRRFGVLWAYGHIDHDIDVTGETRAYRKTGGTIDYHFCPKCGCTTHYVAVKPQEDGRHWTAVNVRLTEPDPIADLPIDHFDGLKTWDDLPRDGRTVRDMWF
ncbi:GFA family protein [Roseibium salinum]|uniref:GFA family protein n=1 Tax=Roseibium salinum TaxID=1604349 RepID=A0ABT3QYY7_9HYPH|nr:GFA family protein [Roseibium sp. DSM 29163]MCX2722172.1 GFA family protein [Roseibium sp. DSM 29163]MDN3719814.1 GFA family protein [Roseibium salinum]